MSSKRLVYLLQQHMDLRLTEPEEMELREYLLNDRSTADIQRSIATLADRSTESKPYAAADWEFIITDILEKGDQPVGSTSPQIPVTRRTGLLYVPWPRYAAAVLLIIGFCTYLYLRKTDHKQIPAALGQTPRDIPAPSSSKAILTLSSGRQISLDSAAEGILARESGSIVTRQTDGQIVYAPNAIPSSPMVYNTLSIPRGSQMASIVLSDGTKVFLNAASSITYPVSFADSERKVVMSGEVYFDVAKDPLRKFIVTAGGLTTTVLGTRFNVNSYPDEDTASVTLLDGKVNVMMADRHILLSPGQQAQSITGGQQGQLKMNPDIDVNEAIAWQKGMFLFNKRSAAVILRQVSRWYDVKLVYTGPVPAVTLSGGLSRNLPLSELLQLLRANGIHCALDNKTLTVQ